MAGTDSSKPIEFRPAPAIILCEPQLGENIGAAARAMANFGLWDLRLVKPRDGWPNERAIASAAKAHHVIERVQVFDTLAAAIADLSLIHATTARSRELQKPVFGPEAACKALAGHIAAGQKAGILFGREKWGLLNEEVALADAIVTLPVEAAFASLNIAQAVLLVSYEWRRQSGQGDTLLFGDLTGKPAPKAEVIGMFEHLETVLDKTGFFTTPAKKPGMVHNLRTMLGRAQFSSQEVRTFRGIISSLDRVHLRRRDNRQHPVPQKPEYEPGA